MSTTVLESFLDTLAKSRLLSPAQFNVIRDQLASRDEIKPASLAKWLVDRKLLTRWQAEELLAGRKDFFLQKYKLLEKVGSGANGTVYKAEQTGMGRIVALKVMPDELAKKPEHVARFRQETRLAAQLHHSHVIAAYDAECDGETHFLVMEYLEGRDLNQWINEYHPLPVRWSCECIRQAAIGLQYAHEQGLVHRDIKPGNLLVAGKTPDDRPLLKVLDMGFARNTNEEGGVRITKAWQIFGTPDYMSPEQAESTLDADIRSDIFSLGVTLFKLLTGTLPFSGQTPVQKLLARANRDAPRVSSLRPDIPPALDNVVAKMLARNIKQRFQTPGEVVEALAAFAWEGKGVAEKDNRLTIQDIDQDAATVQTVQVADPGEPSVLIENDRAATDSNLTASASLSASTIRRDLEQLQASRSTTRVGAMMSSTSIPSAAAASATSTATSGASGSTAKPRVAKLARVQKSREALFYGLLIGGLVGFVVGLVQGALIGGALWNLAGLPGMIAALLTSGGVGLAIGAAYKGTLDAITASIPEDH